MVQDLGDRRPVLDDRKHLPAAAAARADQGVDCEWLAGEGESAGSVVDQGRRAGRVAVKSGRGRAMGPNPSQVLRRKALR